MKAVAKITSKGQITIPKEVRRELGVGVGDSVAFEKNGSAIVVCPVRAACKQSPLERYRGIGNPGIGSGREEVMRYIRELRGDR